MLKLNYQDRPDELAQLEREFHEAQSLSHPNVVSVFDLDRDGNVYFIVMELLEGELLADILKRLDGSPWRVSTRWASSAASVRRWLMRIVATSCMRTSSHATS